MRRFMLLMSVALFLSVTMFSHNLLAIATDDECTGTEICLVTSPGQETWTASCAPCGGPLGFNCVTLTYNLACPIHEAANCDDQDMVLADNPDAFIRPPFIPNIANCCIANFSITFPIFGDCPP